MVAAGTQAAQLETLPPQLAGFDRRAPAEFDRTPGLRSGAILRYLRLGAFATTYLFDPGQGAIPDGLGFAAVQAELRATTEAATVLILSRIAAPAAVNWTDITLGARPGQDGPTVPALACSHASMPQAA